MAMNIVDPVTGTVTAFTRNTSDVAVRANILIELRVISGLLYQSFAPGLINDTLDQMRQDVANESINPNT